MAHKISIIPLDQNEATSKTIERCLLALCSSRKLLENFFKNDISKYIEDNRKSISKNNIT